MEILICVLVAFAAFAFWKSRSTKRDEPTGAGGGSKPSDGNKPDKV